MTSCDINIVEFRNCVVESKNCVVEFGNRVVDGIDEEIVLNIPLVVYPDKIAVLGFANCIVEFHNCIFDGIDEEKGLNKPLAVHMDKFAILGFPNNGLNEIEQSVKALVSLNEISVIKLPSM